MESATRDPATEDRERVGLDSYSYRLRLKGARKPSEEDLRWFMDEVSSLGLDGCQLDPAHVDYDREGCVDCISRLVRERGLYLECGMGGTHPEQMVHRLRAARRAGARALRTFVGWDRQAWTARQFELRPMVVAHLSEAASEAEMLGLPLTVENHGDLTAIELRDILDEVGSPWVGACLDFGNNVLFGEHPLETVRILAPRAHSVHIKDVVLHAGEVRTCLLGDGLVDIHAALEIIRRETTPLPPWTLEVPYMTGGDEPSLRDEEAEFVRENVRRFREMMLAHGESDRSHSPTGLGQPMQ
jgi:sugar phosphate isomerase/epimerase